MLKRGKRSNVLSALILIAGMFGLVIAMTQLVLKDTVSSQSLRIMSLEQKYDNAKNILYSAFEGSVLIAVRDYCLKGYGKNSSLWVENLQLIPDEHERREALIYHLNKSIGERVSTMLLEHPDFKSGLFAVNPNNITIRLESRKYPDATGTMHEGYEIHINKVKLESVDPKGYQYFNYTFSFPLIWTIYDGIKDYLNSKTYDMLDKIAGLTYNKQCSNAQCACGSHLFPLSFAGIGNDVFISESQVKQKTDEYLAELKQYMSDRGLSCDYRYLGFHVINTVTREIVEGGTNVVCSDTVTVTTHSPWQLDVWANEDSIYPGEPLPFQEPYPPYYDYQHPFYYSSFGRNSYVADLANWPVNLKSPSTPPNQDSVPSGEGDWAFAYVDKLWRGAAALIEFHCEDPSHLVIGANPDKPSEVSNLRTLVKFRINTVSNCPDPMETIRSKLITPTTNVACPKCTKGSCADDPTSQGCVANDQDTPDEPVEEICGAAAEPTTINCGQCTALHCSTSCNNKACDFSGAGCDLTLCTGCGSCELQNNQCVNPSICICERTVLDVLLTQTSDCTPVKLCQSKKKVCACKSCFPAGTLVNMADGTLKPIEEVRIGDSVVGYDFGKKSLVKETVQEIESPVRMGYYAITFGDGTTLNVTAEHPIYSRGRNFEGWAAIDPKELYRETSMLGNTLTVGDEVFKIDSRWVKVTSIAYVNTPIQTYNLKRVSNTNTFYAAGVLVHNKEGPGNPGDPGYTPPPVNPNPPVVE